MLIAKLTPLENKLNELNIKLRDTIEEGRLEVECAKILQYKQMAVEVETKLEQRAIIEERNNVI